MKRTMKTPAKKPSLTTLRKAVFEQTAAGIVIVSVGEVIPSQEGSGVYEKDAARLPLLFLLASFD